MHLKNQKGNFQKCPKKDSQKYFFFAGQNLKLFPSQNENKANKMESTFD